MRAGTSGSRRPGLFPAIMAAFFLLALASPRPAHAQPERSQGLTAFRSDAELSAFLRQLRERERRLQRRTAGGPPPPAPPPAAMTAPQSAGAVSEQSIMVTGSRIAQPNLDPDSPTAGITNNQEAEVDEGGIVKMSGDIMVILRRGRLFTVSTANRALRPVDRINAFPPGVSGRGDWYDEMLVSGDRIVVVGYSYARGGTEINRFRMDPTGRLRFEDAYHLRSNDYYSSRNYASRLIGNRLIFYTPLFLDWRRDPLEALPGIRKWEGDAADRNFRRIAGARQVFIAPTLRRAEQPDITTLHSVTTCDLTAPVLDCSATAVLGPSSRTFYVSGEAVYLWVANQAYGRARERSPSAAVYRLPLDRRDRPAAVLARGMPVDQFSFREDRRERMLNVLVRSQAGGDAMWRPEFTRGSVALLRLPLAAFGDGSEEAQHGHYLWLPQPRGDEWAFRNRFVGDFIVYGATTASTDDGKQVGSIVAARVRDGRAAQIPLTHGVGRIEAMGPDALVVGSEGRNLVFTPLELRRGIEPRLGNRFMLPEAQEGESRSHAFFYRPDPRAPDGSTGMLGLPVARVVQPEYRRFFGTAAAMLFLNREQRGFSQAGELEAQVRGVADDDCRASCVDWYGNARPIFLGSRIFALLGYELVEGVERGGRISEVGRVDFAPPPGRRRR